MSLNCLSIIRKKHTKHTASVCNGMESIRKKHTTLVCIAAFIIAMPVTWLALMPFVRALDGAWADAVRYAATAAVTLLLMRIIWKRNVFSFKCPNFFRSLFTFGLVGLIGAAGAFAFGYETVDTVPVAKTVCGVVLMNLAIAVSEEFLFRGVMLNALLEVYTEKNMYTEKEAHSDKKKIRINAIYAAVLVSCVIFGLRHLLNLAAKPNALFMTCAQVVFTFMAGTYLCAVYLRSQNIWVCVLIHILEDLAVSVWPLFSSAAASSASADISMPNALGMVAMLIPYVVFAWLMLRDKKWQAHFYDNEKSPMSIASPSE